MSNTKYTIIGFVLIFSILVGYYFLTAPSKEELLEQRHKQDSMMTVQRQKDSIAQVALEERMKIEQQKSIQDTFAAPGVTVTEKNITVLQDQFGSFALAAKGEAKSYYLENDLMKIGLSSLGGKIIYVELKNYKTWDGFPLVLMDSDTNQFGFSFFANNRTINTNSFYFQPEWIDGYGKGDDTVRVSGDQQAQFALRLYASTDTIFRKDQYIEYLFTLQGNDYMLSFDVNFHNLDKTIDAARGYVDFEWGTDLRKQEKHVDQFNGSTIYYKLNEDKVQYLSESKDDEELLRDQIKWLSFKEHFFSSALIADNYFVDPIMRVSTSPTPPSDRYLRSLYYKVGIPYTGAVDESVGMSMYFGPNKYNILRKYKLDLERQIPLGWSFFLMQWINRYAVLPVFNFLGSFGWNYGIVILVLTILLKIVLFPIAYKTYLSSAKMRLLKPEVDEISQKFPKKEDAMKKQQATMAMY
jgi:YidC/Oxa1 family membrane protein insertase